MSLPNLDDLESIVVDIEGTTTPISFVYDVLFPFAREHARTWLSRHLDTELGRSLLADFRQLAQASSTEATLKGVDAPAIPEDPESALDPLVTFIHRLMDADSKASPLKSLQGLIWTSGYTSGELQGVVWDDVVKAFDRWSANGTSIWIYSSGSVAAQKLLFGNSDHGDLLPYIKGHFDVTTGGKKESASYTTIAESIGAQPDRLLFATDNLAEAHAASDAGWHVVVLRRPGNPEVEEHPFVEAETFDELP